LHRRENHEATQPPIDKPSLAITSFDWQDEAAMKSFMLADDESAALDRFNVFGKVLSDMLDFPKSGHGRAVHGLFPATAFRN
jgi:hypothetical protein